MAFIYLCDNDPIWRHRLKQVVSQYPALNAGKLSVAFCADSPAMLLQHLEAHAPNGGIYFLDAIYQSQMNGMELGQNIRSLDPDATLIYIADQEEMMRETFRLRLQVLDYILKDDKDLCQRIHQCLNHLEQSCPPAPVPSPRIVLQAGRSRKLLAIEEIYYINTVKGAHLLQIHTKNESFTAPGTLHSFERQLEDAFLSCSRSVLVNISHITSADHHARKLLLDNGDACFCSVRMWRQVLQRLDI